MQIKTHLNNEYSNKFFKLILDNPDKNWNWDYISRNPNITTKIILDNPDINWNWCFISLNPNITMKFILDNPDKKWNWYYVSENPNITIKFILDNPDKDWNWSNISCNTFKNNKIHYIKSNIKKILLTKILKIYHKKSNYSFKSKFYKL